jgi:predicted ATPase
MIGANAAGKSNFIEIIKFIRDIVTYDFTNAVSMQGGKKNVLNAKIGTSEELSIKIVSSLESAVLLGKDINGTIKEVAYSFSLLFKRGESFEISSEKLELECEIKHIENEETKEKDSKKNQSEHEDLIITVEREGKNVSFNYLLEKDTKIERNNLYPAIFFESLRENNLFRPYDSLFTIIPVGVFSAPPIADIFRDISIYDIDPKLSKKAIPVSGKTWLEEDGSNLSITLQSILRYKKNRDRFLNYIHDSLPFVNNIKVKNLTGKYLLFSVSEIYNQDTYLPASHISDGTITIAALVVALHFEKHSFMVIEEPERNMHPQLMNKLAHMLQDASSKKQIFVTTHNPEFLKYIQLENILLISRTENGFSQITHPSKNKDVKIFLENEISFHELFADGFLWGNDDE